MNHGYATLDEAYDTNSPIQSDETPSRSPSIQTTSSEETYVIGRSRSPSVLSNLSSPVSNLDNDDYDYTMTQPLPHEMRPPETPPDNMIMKPKPTSAASTTTQLDNNDNEVIKHILRIQKDLHKFIKDEPEQERHEFPFIEVGLFISVGLFVLVAMNTMLNMGKHHITYKFTSD